MCACWLCAQYTGNVDGLGTLRLLDALRTTGLANHTRFYQYVYSPLQQRVRGLLPTCVGWVD